MALSSDIYGTPLNDEGPTEYEYTGTLLTAAVLTNGAKSWRQTYTYDETDKLIASSGWVPQ